MLIIARVLLSAVVVAVTLNAVRATSSIDAAMVLSLGKCLLALLSFPLKASHAGSVQLGVGTVPILAISLTESMRGGVRAD